ELAAFGPFAASSGVLASVDELGNAGYRGLNDVLHFATPRGTAAQANFRSLSPPRQTGKRRFSESDEYGSQSYGSWRRCYGTGLLHFASRARKLRNRVVDAQSGAGGGTGAFAREPATAPGGSSSGPRGRHGRNRRRGRQGRYSRRRHPDRASAPGA